MAKKFLDLLADAYEEEELHSVIPPKRARKRSAEPRKEAEGGRSRKKRFRESINDALPPEPSKGKGRRSLLQTMEAALESEAFDHIFPSKANHNFDQEQAQLESRFSTMITTEVLTRARQIAELKGIRVKDVINTALRIYVEQEWESLQDE